MKRYKFSFGLLLILLSGCLEEVETVSSNEFYKWEKVTTSNGLSHQAITKLYRHPEGSVWAGTLGGGLNIISDGGIEVRNTNNGLSNDVITGITEFYEFTLVGTEYGISYRYNDTGEWGSIVLIYGETFGVWDLITDKDNWVWIATDTYGLIYTSNFEDYYSIWDDNSFYANFVNVFLEDSRGNMWWGTEDGLKKFDGNQIIHYTINNGLSGYSISSLFEDSKGNIWIGYSDSPYVTKLTGTKFTEVDLWTGENSVWVRDIGEDNMGNLYFTSFGTGLIKYDGITFRAMTTETSQIPDDYLLSFMVGNDNNLWVGTYEQGIAKFILP